MITSAWILAGIILLGGRHPAGWPRHAGAVRADPAGAAK